MRVLVTGASGFIGRYVLPLLCENGWEVYAIARRPSEQASGVRWIAGDLLTLEKSPSLQQQVREASATHMLHLAWYTKHGEFWRAEENFQWVDASMALLRVFHQGGGRKAVIAGTCAEYDWSHGYCREDKTPCRPSSVYGICKHALHLLAGAWCDARGMNLCWGRIFFPYGPGESSDRLIPYLIRCFLEGKTPVCRNGGAYRDFLHIEDVAGAFFTLLEQDGSGTFNISSSELVRIQHIACELGQLLDRSDLVPDYVQIDPSEPNLLAGDNKRLASLGWVPQITLSGGLSTYIDIIKESKS